MTPTDVLKLIKEKQVKFADLRFTDTRGKEQHVTIPARLVDEDLFRDGKMFDGSSIGGWKGINESDMILMPEAATAIIDPFFEETTIDIRCDVIEPATMQGYERDPRSLAKRAEAYLKSTGIADTALFGPENEFFIFDSVRFSSDINGAFYRIDSVQGAWNSAKDYQEGNRGHRPAVKGGYFPVPPVDAYQDIRSAMCLACEEMGLKVEVHHHEVATGGQGEIDMRFAPLTRMADNVMIYKYVVKNVAKQRGMTAARARSVSARARWYRRRIRCRSSNTPCTT
jgi:glutamine synthetase